MLRHSLSTALVLGAVTVTSMAQAQIISQTPRPEVPEAAEAVTVLKPQGRIGTSGVSIKIPKTGGMVFAGFDDNSDYIIDRTEVALGIKRAFKAADKDGSGKLSLVELERWRTIALGSIDATPTNFAFAPNFARTVSEEKFTEVLQGIANKLDTDDQGEQDGQIAIGDLLRNYTPPRAGRNDDENCVARVRDERRRVEQICRSQRGY